MPPRTSRGHVVPFDTTPEPEIPALGEVEPEIPADDEPLAPVLPDPVATEPPASQPLFTLDDVKAMIAEALVEHAKANPPAPKLISDETLQATGTYPVPYYNPRILNEQFYINGSPYRSKFSNGRFVAMNSNQEESVRICLRAHGPDKPDRWRGDNRSRAWTDPATGFTTLNDNARYDYEHYHQD